MSWVKINQRKNKDRRADRTYTQAELDEAVKAEKQKAAIVCEKLSYIDLDYTPLDCAEAIRKSKESSR